MTTPIDTTRLRALLDEATDPPEWSVATLAGCIRIVDTDGGIVATVSEATDAALIVGMRGSVRALLDEVERLRARLAPVVEPERGVVIWHYRNDEETLPANDDPDEATYFAIHNEGHAQWDRAAGRHMLTRPEFVDETVTIYGYARMAPSVIADFIVERELERLDEELGEPGGDESSEPTPAMLEAAEALATVIEREYKPWACEVIETRVVNVREWCAAHRPEWLAQLPATEPEEGGTR